MTPDIYCRAHVWVDQVYQMAPVHYEVLFSTSGLES